MTKQISREVFTDPITFLSFGFGTGLLPSMPGTWGTLIAIPFYLLFRSFPWQLYLALVLVTFVVGIWMCEQTEKKCGVHDDPGIVWDELVGYWTTMFLAPAGLFWVIIGFLLFRFFDIFKPWPIGWLNRHASGGWGVMIDDFVAGIFSFILLQILAWIISVLIG
ncbi:MAG: phosphatidylglycerophosphatase A [Gammaproteobacteria bacterium]|nr:phosphatidylglycerophosphatase A [Gammaproteobacteria bacterium]